MNTRPPSYEAESEAKPDQRSKALPYELVGGVSRPRADEWPAPHSQTADEASGTRPSPLTLVWAAGLLLVLLVMVISRLAAANQARPALIPPPGAQICQVQAESPLNVRSGPGFEYSRIWILEAGQPRQALAQDTNGAWFALENGWLPREAVQMNSISACSQLPRSQSRLLFQDRLPLPAEVAALDWYQIFDEGFATDLNGWLLPSPPNTAAIREGSLILFAFGDQTALVYPETAPSYYPLKEAYYGLAASWIASDEEAELQLLARASSEGAYELSLRRDGALRLSWLPTEGRPAVLDEAFLPGLAGENFQLGLLHQGTRLAVFVNGQRRFEVRHDAPPAGTYHLSLKGEQTSLQIQALAILIPPNDGTAGENEGD